MCGIIGYVGNKNAAEEVREGLFRLEYRGYDSAGAAIMDENGIISVVKKQGKVANLAPYLDDMSGRIGIGHTRWATHGKPSDANAHPHSSGKITVVHNGIIENYAELKSRLEACGERFFSQTDSEVAAKLINRNFKGDLLCALAETAKMLKGSYALMAICEGVSAIAVAKYRSSVILGYGDDEYFCASDEPALAGKCSSISVLEDGDLAYITPDGIEIYDGGMQQVIRDKRANTAAAQSLDLCGYPRYMLKELYETPAAVEKTIKEFNAAAPKLREALRGINRIILLGCGTAYHAGLVGKRYFEAFARIPAECENAGEFRYKNPVVCEGAAVFAVSQSGETADTVEAARLARTLGAKVIAVTNAPNSALTRLADVVAPVAAGTEICVAATKSYAAQIACLYLCALTFAGEPLTCERAVALTKMPALCEKTLASVNTYSIANMCAGASGVYFLGRDVDYAVALEGSLKLKEVSYVPGEGYPAGELKHGTLALIDGKTVCVALVFDKNLAKKCENAVEQVLSRGGRAVVITNVDGVCASLKDRVRIISLPDCDKFLSPLISAVAVQKLAYETAAVLGRDPDKPRNLAKSVTVE